MVAINFASASFADRNRLSRETSPYLLQHAGNPVDWYPWGSEAIVKARKEDKPIFLSIGYFACHWCHVMERESFENEEIAAILNRNFVSIKVDREERPDIDAIYMKAVQMMTGSGGWPLSVFLTPDLKPFYGGTYFPPDSRRGGPGLKELAERIAELYQTRKADLVRDGAVVTERLAQTSLRGPAGFLDFKILDRVAAQIFAQYDAKLGGYQGAPKFPSPTSLGFLIAYGASRRPHAAQARFLAELTLNRMLEGGIYDQLGGGFHRYSTDDRWFVPHFEKMLYDNAQLARLYVEAWQLTGKPVYRRIARETLDYLLREMQSPEGGFYSTQDADSEGVEGKYYTWTWEELKSALPGGIEETAKFWNVTKEGNWEDARNILYLKEGQGDYKEAAGPPQREALWQWRKKHKPAPGRDDKILADWNALAAGTFAYAGAALNEPRYIEAAQGVARYFERYWRLNEGKVFHYQGASPVSGLLEDYAFWMLAFIDLYEATLDLSYLDQARSLAQTTIEFFWDDQGDAFYSFARQGADPHLIANLQESYDGVLPSGNSAAALAFLRLGRYLELEEFLKVGAKVFRAHVAMIEKAPSAVTFMLQALMEQFEEPWQIKIEGSREHPKFVPLCRALTALRWPAKMWAGEENRNANPKVYLCQGKTCLLPTDDPIEIAKFAAETLPSWK